MQNKTKGILFLCPEADGFNVPELINSGKILDSQIAQDNFDKVIVAANSANYIKMNKPNNKSILTEQWDSTMVTDLGIPVEKWVFVCCSSPGISAQKLIDDLLKDFTDIAGFLIDTEDSKESITDFVTVFNKIGSKYKYGIVGGPMKNMPPKKKYGMTFDYLLSEMYTEGEEDLAYYVPNSNPEVDGSICIDTSDNKFITKFWDTVDILLGNQQNIVPTFCGSGNCQGTLSTNSCFDERLSYTDIGKFISGNKNKQNVAIWYGTGQQPVCEPNVSCLANSKTTCDNDKKCIWNDAKKTPTGGIGGCFSSNMNWGCAINWK
tara:strand:- start:5898 stop:6857 length:960 start_codon:yes stop_codon:yes gene_type:complete